MQITLFSRFMVSLLYAQKLPEQQWSVRFLGITGWDPSVCKSNRFHGNILWFSFIKLGYILSFPLEWSLIFLQSWWTSTGYLWNSTGSSVINCRFSPIIAGHCFVEGPVQWSGIFLDITGWDPSVCKSNRLNVDNLQFSFIKLVVYSMNSSKMIGNFPAV